jgi:5-methylcytosine-specific restriction endonuclease McrA
MRKYSAERSKKWRSKNKSSIKKNLLRTRTHRLATMREWKKNHKAEQQAYQEKYRSKPEKKAIRAALQSKREALKQNATLPDTNFKKIQEIYLLRGVMSEESGIFYQVDHIIPLSIGGAHHQDNLQIITREENASKSDIWNPEKYPNQLTAKWANSALARKNKKKFNVE